MITTSDLEALTVVNEDGSIGEYASGDADRRRRRIRIVGLIVVVLSLLVATVTFFILMGLTPIEPTRTVVWTALAINAVLVLFLVAAITREVYGLLQARRRGRAAARLHVRFVALFSIIATLPAILVAIVASITLDRGLDRWFEERTRTIVGNAMTVANAYLQEHARVLRAELLAMAVDVDRARALYDFEPSRFDVFFQTQSQLRQIPAAYLIQGDRTVLTRYSVDTKAKIPLPPPETIAKATEGEPTIVTAVGSNLVGGVMKLSAYDDIYLYVARGLDPRVIEYLHLAQENANQYKALEDSRFGVQMAFALLYVGVALVLLLSAIWVGIAFANQLVAPIRRLIGAADQVSRGNLDVKVNPAKREGDLARLGATFNNMTAQLRHQRSELLDANDQIDRRRRFTEAVLAGVTAGVLGIDEDGRISLINRSALELLGAQAEDIVGKPASDVVPEISDLIEASRLESLRMRQGQVTLVRDGRERILNVRATIERSPSREHGVVLTLDDITDLVSAQRATAWADVARRIAHEIKNPLTPIQLSAERLKRRYGRQVEDDKGVFDQCIDTIVRQVGDIGRMVDEFSSFARMPKAVMEQRDLVESIREAVFLQSVSHPDIAFETDFERERMVGRFDHRLLVQAVTNVVKNATEAISQLPAELEEAGRIRVVVKSERDHAVIDVIDNGIGLPEENRQRLLEPYMTTREKGTGLGLAIVGKIMEEHGGRIELLDAPDVATGGRGAMVRLTLGGVFDAAAENDALLEKSTG